MSIRSPSIRRIIKKHLEKELIKMHVAMPGHVVSWDHEKQCVDVRFDLQRQTILEDLSVDLREFAIARNVPLMFPRTNTHQITMPVAEGDRVLVVFCDFDLNQWSINNEPHTSSGRVTAPGFLDNHTLNGAVAIPGLYPTHTTAGENGPLSKPGASGDATEIMIGKIDAMAGVKGVDDKYSDFVAMAAKVLDELGKIKTQFDTIKTKYDLHTHGSFAPVPSLANEKWDAMSDPVSVACTDVKITTDETP